MNKNQNQAPMAPALITSADIPGFDAVRTVPSSSIESWPTAETFDAPIPAEVVRTAGAAALLGVDLSSGEASSRVSKESPLEKAKAAFKAQQFSGEGDGDYSALLSGQSEFDDIVEGLSTADKRALEAWQVEQAAKRTPKFYEILHDITRDSGETYRPDAAQSKAIVESLSQYGIHPETNHDLQAEVEHARRLVAQGADGRLLDRLAFMSDRSFSGLLNGTKRVQVALTGTAVEVDARQLSGAEGFDSWMGRGRSGAGEVNVRRVGADGRDKRQSIEQIRDYATRETELPYLDSFGLSVVLTDKGTIYYSHNAHRAGAAQLRDGTVRANFLNLYDIRGQAQKALLVDQALDVVKHNTTI